MHIHTSTHTHAHTYEKAEQVLFASHNKARGLLVVSSDVGIGSPLHPKTTARQPHLGAVCGVALLQKPTQSMTHLEQELKTWQHDLLIILPCQEFV